MDRRMPIGARKLPTLQGVAVRKAEPRLGASLPSLAPIVPVAGPETEARNTTLGPVVRARASASAAKAPVKRAPAPAPAFIEMPAIAEAPTVATEAPTVAVEAPTVAAEAPIATVGVTAEAPKVTTVAVRKATTTALPSDAPLITKEEFTTDFRRKVASANPVEAAAKLYRPISAPTFRDFIVQTYAQFSPMLLRVLKEGEAAIRAEKELDRDACKKRDPDKVETFYYQKFVRDYLSRGTPYRGLLVYHGLGTGKTCTSIAAAEALYYGGQKVIYVLTPATLSNNYRRELGKCGYFPLRQNNRWAFLPLSGTTSKPQTEVAYIWLTSVLGLPGDIVLRQGGGWVPDPTTPSNWSTLSTEVQEAIRAQQIAHLNHRFRFIHYNGVTPAVLAELAAKGVEEGKSMFDDAVVIIDEIHNLVRTINGTQIGSKSIAAIIASTEPREPTWSTPLGRKHAGFRYPRGYTLYRLLQNAVGAKVIALSATPMINYAQEMAILMNIVGGEQRMVEISLKGMARDPTTLRRLEEWAQRHPDVDFYAIEESAVDKSTVLNLTPVPYGFSKVVDSDFATRGFVRGPSGRDSDVRGPSGRDSDVRKSRERNMWKWSAELVRELENAGILKSGTAAEADAAVATAAPWIAPKTTAFQVHTFPLLPEDPRLFVANFVDRNTLRVLHANVLKARASGLISYYRGGSEELMPRVTLNEIVRVPMSEYMFQEYSRARLVELDMETPAEKADEDDASAKGPRRKGMTAAEMDLYTQATKTPQTGFLALSRAACNWVFPEDVPRPSVSIQQQAALLGIDKEPTVEVTDSAAEPGDTEPSAAVLPDGEDGGEASASAAVVSLDATLANIVGTLMSGLEAKADEYLNRGLSQFSPKYATILANVRRSPGPVLVYSQFKTLEGLGIFAAALRAADEKYLPLDIQKNAAGEWEIPAALMEADPARPRYILYTGDQELEKRRLLLQLYNAELKSLPPRLAAQCSKLLAGAPDNRDGRVCRIFMITQSGAEGISLFNTRQVHIMEPYWTNVRLQQVIGRAIRLCSHMNLPWDERTVEIYTYLSVFSSEQKAEGAKKLMMADKALTTDESIFGIAENKQRLADSLSEIVQSAAVDCELHYHEHGAATQCFRFAEGGHPMFMYHPDWRKDIQADVGTRSAAGM